MILGAGLLCALLILAIRPFVSLIYDARYQAVGAIGVLLLAGIWIQSLSSAYGSMLLAAGTPRPMTIGFMLRFATFLLGVNHIYHAGGILAASMLVSASELPVAVVCFLGSRRRGLASGRQDAGPILIAFAAVAAAFAYSYLTR